MAVLFDAFKEFTDHLANKLTNGLWSVGETLVPATRYENDDLFGKFDDHGAGGSKMGDWYNAVNDNLLYCSSYMSSLKSIDFVHSNVDNSNIYIVYVGKENTYDRDTEFNIVTHKIGNMDEYTNLAGEMMVKLLYCANYYSRLTEFYTDIKPIPSEYLQYITFQIILSDFGSGADDASVIDSTWYNASDYYDTDLGCLLLDEEFMKKIWKKILDNHGSYYFNTEQLCLGVKFKINKDFFAGRYYSAFIPFTSDGCWLYCDGEYNNHLLKKVQETRTASSTFKKMVADNVSNYGTSYDTLSLDSGQFLENGRVIYMNRGILNPPGPGLVPCVVEVKHLRADGSCIKQTLTSATNGTVYERVTNDSGMTWSEWKAMTPVETVFDISSYVTKYGSAYCSNGLINSETGEHVSTGVIPDVPTDKWYYYYPDWYAICGNTEYGISKAILDKAYPGAKWLEIEVPVPSSVLNAAEAVNITPTVVFDKEETYGCDEGEWYAPYETVDGVQKYRIDVPNMSRGPYLGIFTFNQTGGEGIKFIVHYDDMPTA